MRCRTKRRPTQTEPRVPHTFTWVNNNKRVSRLWKERERESVSGKPRDDARRARLINRETSPNRETGKDRKTKELRVLEENGQLIPFIKTLSGVCRGCWNRNRRRSGGRPERLGRLGHRLGHRPRLGESDRGRKVLVLKAREPVLVLLVKSHATMLSKAQRDKRRRDERERERHAGSVEHSVKWGLQER